MRARRQGPVPERPFLLVCNHLGYVDILLLGRYLPAVFVAKTEVADWPLLGRLVRAADTIFVDRDRKRQLQAVNGRIRDALDGGAGVVLFAEGTSSPGHTVLPLRPSLLQVATGTARPVHWAVVRYATGAGSRPAEEAVCWWGDMGFFSHLVGLLRLRSFEAAVCFGAEPVMDDDRKRLAEQLGGLMRTGLAVC